MLEHIRRDLPNNEIVHPVATRAHRNPVCPIAQWPDFRNQDPRTWTPAIAEIDDEEPNEGDRGPAGSFSALDAPRVFVTSVDDGDGKVAKSHANSTNQQDRFAAETVDIKDRADGGPGGSSDWSIQERAGLDKQEHDHAYNTSCQQASGVAGGA